MVDKHQLINQLKKNNYINHERYASAFTHDRFNFFINRGKLKIRYYLLQKGIEETYIDHALNTIDYSAYKLLEEEASKKYLAMGSPKDFEAKQKLSKYLNQKGFEGELIFEVVENL